MVAVTRLLRRKWSAERIAGTLKKRGTLNISHETICQRIGWDKKLHLLVESTPHPIHGGFAEAGIVHAPSSDLVRKTLFGSST